MMQMRKRVKGFTLVELIVVLAIIGIFAAMLIPTMITYYRRSQLKKSNTDAKMVYNAVQTELQRYTSIDRSKNAKEKSMFNGMIMIAYDRDGTISYTTEKSSAFVVPAEGSKEREACDAIMNAVHRVVSDSDTFNWAVYVENYMVKACISAPFDHSVYVGQCSAGNAMSTEMSEQPYSQLLAASGDNNELVRIVNENYDVVATEAPTGAQS